jgi:hypothetical protein
MLRIGHLIALSIGESRVKLLENLDVHFGTLEEVRNACRSKSRRRKSPHGVKPIVTLSFLATQEGQSGRVREFDRQ